jgi:hypothetical protein
MNQNFFSFKRVSLLSLAFSVLSGMIFLSIGCGAGSSAMSNSGINNSYTQVPADSLLKISAFRDISSFILETLKEEYNFNIDIKYVKSADEAHSDLTDKKADLVFMSYDDTLSIALEDNYPDIRAVMPIHCGILDLCGDINLEQNKNIVGIDTESGYARALRHYFHLQYDEKEYNKLKWVHAGATDIRYAKLISGELNATLLNPPFSYKPGASQIANMYSVVGSYQGVVVNVNDSWLQVPSNKAKLKNFLQVYYAYVQKLQSNPTQTIHKLEQFYTISNDVATLVFNRLWQPDGLGTTYRFNLEDLLGTENLFAKDTGITVPKERRWILEMEE